MNAASDGFQSSGREREQPLAIAITEDHPTCSEVVTAGVQRKPCFDDKPFKRCVRSSVEGHAQVVCSLLGSRAQTIGFQSFASFMEKKIEHMFADAINPVLDKLRDLKVHSFCGF